MALRTGQRGNLNLTEHQRAQTQRWRIETGCRESTSKQDRDDAPCGAQHCTDSQELWRTYCSVPMSKWTPLRLEMASPRWPRPWQWGVQPSSRADPNRTECAAHHFFSLSLSKIRLFSKSCLRTTDSTCPGRMVVAARPSSTVCQRARQF
jgi:hypothetical protein